MEFKIEKNRIYVLSLEGDLLAEITFKETREEVYTIDHTYVESSLRGKGVASKLMELAVKKIEDEGKKVEATCSYAKVWLERHK